MDNFHFDMTSEGRGNLKAALCLFAPPGRRVTGYRVDGKRLILYWTGSKSATPLPFPMPLDQASDFAAEWLDNQDYGVEPSHDGDNGKGWRLYNESWSSIGGDHAAFVAIEPVWAMYGK